VYLGFRLGDPAKNIQGPFFRSAADTRSLNDAPDLPPGIVGMFMVMAVGVFAVGVFAVGVVMVVFAMVVVMLMVVGVVVFAVGVAVVMVVIVIISGDVIGLAAEIYHGMGSGDASALIGGKFQGPA
jgi:hypothetical protein